MKSLSIWILSVGAALLPLQAAAQDVAAGIDSGVPGDTVVIPVTLVAGGDLAGIDLDITFTAGQFSAASASCTANNACSGAFTNCSVSPDGTANIIVAAGSACSSGTLGEITLTIDPAATAGDKPLIVTIVGAGDSLGTDLDLSTIGITDGNVSVLGAAYASTPAPTETITLGAKQNDPNPFQDVMINNVGVAGTTLTGTCSETSDPDDVFTISGDTDFAVGQPGTAATVTVTCDATADVGLHTGLMACTHNGDNIGDAVYPLSCNIEAFTAKSPGINAGHSGAWFNPETSGQGQFIDVVPEEQFMFISWFTFTDAASDNPNEQQWYTAQGNYSGDTAVLDLFETLGGKFDDPQEVTTTQVGEVTLTFSDCDMGMMSYIFDEEELLGEFPMIRVIPGSDNVCKGLSENNTEALDINAGMDGAWFDPDTSGQGYFIDAHPDPEGGNFIFVSWFTYGDETASGQRWLTAQGGFEGSMAEIDVFETTGGSFDDPMPPDTIKAGAMSLDFTDCINALLSYSLPANGAEGDIAITRVIPGGQTLCEELAGAE
jgi:hypothetical protein